MVWSPGSLGAPAVVIRRRSTLRIVRIRGSVKFWMEGKAPGVDVVRPARCPRCSTPGRTTGGSCGLHGHGLRVRQLLGPAVVGGVPVLREVTVRRYQCQQCRLVMAVTTEALLPRKHFGAGTIGLALWLWSVTRWPAAKVRDALSPRATIGDAAAGGWASVKRWASEACSSGLWLAIGTTLLAGLRGQTERVMRQLEALGPLEQPPEQCLWCAAHQSR